MKIAVVEKNVAIQEYVKAGFMTFAENAQIESFSNAKEFLEVFKENPDAFNMVLLNTDYESPGSGLTIAEKVRRLSMKVAILFVTRNADYYSEAFKVFALGYLLFPFDIRDLQNCVNFYSKNATKERRASWLLKTSDGWRRVYCRFITYVESDNREIIIKSNSITSPFEVKKIEGEGMPIHKFPSQKGDLYITFKIKFPESFSKEEKLLIEDIFKHPEKNPCIPQVFPAEEWPCTYLLFWFSENSFSCKPQLSAI